MRVLKSFEYFVPGTVEEAVQLLVKCGAKAKVLAGGCDLVPSMRRREIQPEYVVGIRNIAGLDYIEGDGREGLRIGALASIRSIEASLAVQKDYIALYEAVHSIASIQVKNTGTAVGNLCVATPASDIATPLFVFGAKLRIASSAPEKIIPIDDFFIGVKQSILQPGEIVTEVLVPGPPAGTGSAFLKLVRTAADIAKINVAVMVQVTDNTCKEAKIALGSVAPTPIWARRAEELLKGQRLDQKVIEAAAEAAAEETKPITDLRSTAEYRKQTAKVLVRRAIAKALERAKV